MDIEDESGTVVGECRPGVVCPECAMRMAENNRLRDDLRLMMAEIDRLKDENRMLVEAWSVLD